MKFHGKKLGIAGFGLSFMYEAFWRKGCCTKISG